MQFELLRPHELSPAHLGAWAAIQQADATLESPFFAPEFAQAAGRARRDAHVGVMRRGGDVVGFFPFHRRRGRVGAPIGGPICDYQGLIAARQVELKPAELLHGCDLSAFDFNHAPASQETFRAASFTFADSPALDLSQGFEAYRQGRIDAGTKELQNAERKRRKLERELGPIRFVANDRDPAAWRQFILWKNESYKRLQIASILDVAWVRTCLEELRDVATANFSGMLSALYAGERLAAAHFGMRTRTCWHWWFPTYDIELEKYSPGLALLLEMAQWAPAHGVARIDLGRGKERYKLAFADIATPLCEGSLELPASLPGAARRARKFLHGAAALTGSARLVDFQRRALNRALRVGRLEP